MPTFGEMLAGTAEPTLRRSVIDPTTGRPFSLAAPTGEVVERGSVLPIGRDDAGRLVPAVPGMLISAAEAAALPGQVARGEFSIFDPRTGHVSDEAIGKGMDLAGLAMTGSLPFKAPSGALRSFGGAAAKEADDPLAALTAALSGIEREAPTPGPRTLDPNAKSWDLFHGSGEGPDFARFDPSKSRIPAERDAVFFAPDPETASQYAGGSGAGAAAGPRVFRTTVQPGKTDVIDIGRLAETDPAFNARARELTLADNPRYGQVFDDYMNSFRASRADDARVAQLMQEMGVPPDPNAATRISYGHGHIGAAIERAKAQGLDTAILRGLAEHGGDDQVVALTPGRVRSFYAPDQVLFSGGSAGALPGVAAGASGGSQQNPGFESNLGSLSRAYMTRK